MEKSSIREDELQLHSDGIRPTCCVPPHTHTHRPECVLLRPDAEIAEEMSRSDAFISLDTEMDVTSRRRRALVRSKTFDPSLLLQIQSDSELKCERRKPQLCHSLRTNSQYHKVFKDVCQDEPLRQSYTCALQKDILYQGRLFVSDNWICFHSKVFGKDTRISIPVSSVTVIKKTKTAILVPNALVISTARARHVFVSFLSRDTTFKVLMSVCPHLVEESPGVSQIGSRSRIAGHTPSLTPDFSADLSDVDAPVTHTDQRMDDSSSSDCPESPEYVKTHKFQKRSQAFIEVVKRNAELDSHTKQETDAKTNSQHTGSPGSEVVLMQTLRPVSLSLNALVLIYLSLVCVLLLSSCYMAFKIVSLEERLTSLVPVEFPHRSFSSADSAQISSLLSASLLKLEKIHRNLQSLMESVGAV